jgi:hypothetical protein
MVRWLAIRASPDSRRFRQKIRRPAGTDVAGTHVDRNNGIWPAFETQGRIQELDVPGTSIRGCLL